MSESKWFQNDSKMIPTPAWLPSGAEVRFDEFQTNSEVGASKSTASKITTLELWYRNSSLWNSDCGVRMESHELEPWHSFSVDSEVNAQSRRHFIVTPAIWSQDGVVVSSQYGFSFLADLKPWIWNSFAYLPNFVLHLTLSVGNPEWLRSRSWLISDQLRSRCIKIQPRKIMVPPKLNGVRSQGLKMTLELRGAILE